MKNSISLLVITLNLIIVLQCNVLLTNNYSYEAGSIEIFQTAKSFIKNNIFHQSTNNEFNFPSLASHSTRKRMEFIWKANGYVNKDELNYIYLITDFGQIKEIEVNGKVHSLIDNYFMRIEDFQTMERFKNIYDLKKLPFSLQIANLKYTFGKNAGGIYWFAPDGTYYEWFGSYYMSAEKLLKGNYGL
ncbi:MAG: hypothetical protein K0R54_263 [Clostridiaceae bacterium]|jgi:hypothetical protein|nr:hypothetical protein [Clostridiaceae bacterium]